MVITLSRQAESGGDEIAESIAAATGLRVADRVILEQIAQRAGLPISRLQLFDEAIPGPLEALLAEWQTSVSQASYMRRLVHTLLMLEREDNVVIVGRGGAFVLTNPGTLHVRITAPLPCRVARLMERQSVSQQQAERILRRIDEERQRFVHSIFGTDVNDPTYYDLVLNTAELTYPAAADVIARAAAHKAQQRQALPSAPDEIIARVQRLQSGPHQPRVSEVVWQFCQRRPRSGF